MPSNHPPPHAEIGIQLRRIQLHTFYLACREAFGGATPPQDADRLLGGLRATLGLSPDHACRLGRLAREQARRRGGPARTLTRARVLRLAQEAAEGSPLPRTLWWRQHLQLRAGLRTTLRDAPAEAPSFVAELDTPAEAALYAALVAAPGEEASPVPAWAHPARRLAAPLLALYLLTQGLGALAGDLASTRTHDVSAPQRVAHLMAEAREAQAEGAGKYALQLLRKAEWAAMKIADPRTRHLGIAHANLEQARLLARLGEAGDREEILEAYEEALFALGEAEAPELQREKLRAEVVAWRRASERG